MSTINMKVPVNSICVCYKDDIPEYMIAGTFNGGVIITDLESEKIIQSIDKRHLSYVSSVCALSVYDDRYVCSISADSIVVWEVSKAGIKEIMEIPLNWIKDGDYKWWEVIEIKGLTESSASSDSDKEENEEEEQKAMERVK